MTLNITASVHSWQEREMNIDEGTTCEKLRNILYGAGLDVHASVIRVFRGGKIYIGRMEGFVLKEGDNVEFRTSYDLGVDHPVKVQIAKTPKVEETMQGFPTREQITEVCNAIFDHFHIG